MPRKTLTQRTPPDSLTQGVTPLRDEILALAGVDRPRQAALVRAALEADEEALRATQVQRLVVPGARGSGASVAEYVDVDHPTRLRASDNVKRALLPVLPRYRLSGGGPTLVVQVTFKSRKTRPPVIDVTPSGS